MSASIVRGDLSSQVRRVQLGIRVGRVSISASAGGEHHIAAVDAALVHLPQMHGRKVDLEGALITKSLETNVALNSFLAGRRVDVGEDHVVPELLFHLG